MTKKLEINFNKKPEMVLHFDQFLNVEQAVDKFLNKKENLERLIAPLIPTNLEDTIQKLIPEVKDGYTPKKGVDYDDGEDGETPTEEQIASIAKPIIQSLIPPPIKPKDGVTPKKGIDYFTKTEIDSFKKVIKEAILSEIPKSISEKDLNVRFENINKALESIPISRGSYLRSLIDVKLPNLENLQYGFTYNPSTSEFTLTEITGGSGAVDSVNGQTGVVVLDADDISDTSTTKKFTSTTEKNTWNAKQNALTADVDYLTPGTAGSTYEPLKGADDNYVTDAEKTAIGTISGKEDVSNKSTNVTTDGASDTKYPSVKSVKDYADGLVVGLLDYRGAYDASVNTFPASGGSGTAGAVLKGDMWVISVAGTLGGTAVQIGDSLISNTDTPGQTAGNWNILNGNISYAPEDVANKKTDLTDNSDTYYPSQKAVKTAVDAKQATLVSGTNIKTINSTSLLGSGDISVATTGQGALADSALQPGDIASGTITARADDINFSGGSDGDVLTVQADGSLAVETPAAGGDMVLASVQSVTGLKTFDKDKIAMKGTSTGVNTISVANTSATSYTNTLPAKDGTFAMTSDIPIDGSGTTNEIPYWVDSNTLGTLAIATYPSLTELSYVKGVSSAIQTQLNAKGVGDMLLGTAQSVTETKTFTKDKLLVKGTSTGTTNLTTANTGATNYTATFPAKDGTVAMTSDITGTNSNTNTGDQTITNSSDATSHTVTLSASGGSVQLVEGTGVTLTTSGSASAGIVTIASTATGGATFVLKTADETVNNSNVLQNDDELTVAVAANKTYAFTCFIVYDSGVTPAFGYAWDYPSGATMYWTDQTYGNYVIAIETTTTVFGSGSASRQGITLTGQIKTSSTAGNLTLKWAQHTANASNTIVRAGSFLKLETIA